MVPLAPTRLLNIGSGPYYMPGWINVDRYAEDADVRCDAFAMPLPDDVFERVYMGHFLEHIPLARMPELFAEIARVCEDGALVCVVGPCVIKARETGQPDWLIEQIEANPTPEMPGAGHEWTPTTALTLGAMLSGGLREVVEVPVATVSRPEWPNTVPDAPWQVAAQGRIARPTVPSEP